MRRLGLVTLVAALFMVAAPATPAQAADADIYAPSTAEMNNRTEFNVMFDAFWYDDYQTAQARIEDEAGNVVLSTTLSGTGDQPTDSVAYTFMNTGIYCLVLDNFQPEPSPAGERRACLTVVDTAPKVTRLSGAAPFYPLVKDRFKDTARIEYRVDQIVFGSVRIMRGSTVVRSEDLGVVRAENRSRSFAWDGKDNRGRLVKPGTYRVHFDANDGTHVTTRSITSTVVTDVVTRRKRMTKPGSATSARAGNCSFTDFDYGNELRVDCWGFFSRAAAEARWAFRAPSPTARMTNWRIVGEVGCCDTGILRKSGSLEGRRAVLRLQLSGTRAFTVSFVTATFIYDQRR